MSLLDRVVGRPLASAEEAAQGVKVLSGVAVFGLNALGSAAYGPEAALTVLIPAGIVGLPYILPLSAAVVTLLVYFSYRQTIESFPNRGGAYTVASKSLGRGFGLVAGAALMLDHLLNVSVGISTGTGALVSAAPSLQKQTLPLCLMILVVLIVVNLRGTRTSGLIWRFSTVGIVMLSAISGGAFILFRGVTDRLIPLFAIGAFLAFTFSQWGMVQHWRSSDHPRARLDLSINAVGAIATGATTLLVLIAKFTSGAWITLALLVSLIFLMQGIHKHYAELEAQTHVTSVELDPFPERPLLLIPIDRWNRASAAVRFVGDFPGIGCRAMVSADSS